MHVMMGKINVTSIKYIFNRINSIIMKLDFPTIFFLDDYSITAFSEQNATKSSSLRLTIIHLNHSDNMNQLWICCHLKKKLFSMPVHIYAASLLKTCFVINNCLYIFFSVKEHQCYLIYPFIHISRPYDRPPPLSCLLSSSLLRLWDDQCRSMLPIHLS